MDWQLASADDALYYWKNFNSVRRWILNYHSELLSDEQHQALDQYRQLSANAQRLWLRLFMRKGELFVINKIDYREIELHEGLNELITQGWISPFTGDSSQALALFTKAELTPLVNEAGVAKLPKQAIIERLCRLPAVELPMPVIELQKQALFEQLCLIFFGNSYQQLSELVVTALGHVNYEQYVVRPRSVFPDREHFAEFCRIEQWQQHYKSLDDINDRIAFAQELKLEQQTTIITERYRGKLSRFINRVARDCERVKQTDFALLLYQQSNRTPSRERRARILKQQGSSAACYQLLRQMYQTPWDAPEFEVAQRLLLRWFKEDNIDRGHEPRVATVQLSFKPRDVEQALLRYYQQLGWQGTHAENLIPQALFGLVFWDIIFADIAEAFVHPFQRAPRDLTSPRFFSHRKKRIQRRLEALKNRPAAVRQRVHNNLKTKAGITNSFVPWRGPQLPTVVDWFDRIPPAVWATIFERMAFDIKNNRSGFPDLWLYNDKDEVKLVEAKAPGDTLRANQSRWIAQLLQLQLDVELVNAKPVSL